MPGLLVVGLEKLTIISYVHSKLTVVRTTGNQQSFRNKYAMKIMININL